MSSLKKGNTKQRSASSVSSSVKTTADKQGLGDNNIPPLKTRLARAWAKRVRGCVGGVMNGVNDGVVHSDADVDEQAFIDYARGAGVQLGQFITV